MSEKEKSDADARLIALKKALLNVEAEKDANKVIEKLVNFLAIEEQEDDATTLNKALLARKQLLNDLKDYELIQVFSLFIKGKSGKYYKNAIPENFCKAIEYTSDALEEGNYDLSRYIND